MRKYFLLFFILSKVAIAQNDDIHYDWSGQYGVISNNGQLMWNQDWQVGVLLIDGTFTNYPTRFGDLYKNNFNIKETSEYYHRIYAIPDTNNVSSKLNYFRGDYSHDQLEVDFQFEEKNRIIALSGFKRTYSGPYGQYVDSDDGGIPLHQSYRIDYSSIDGNQSLDLAIGYFNTDSRLNPNSIEIFSHKEKITTAGIGYSREFNKWQYNAHGVLFQQYYKISYDSLSAYLNRIHLNQFIVRELKNNISLKVGLEVDDRGLSIVDSSNIDRLWSTFYGGWKSNATEIRIGTTLAKSEYHPYIKLSNQLKLGAFGNIFSDISNIAKPKYLLFSLDENGSFDNWLIADLNGNFKLFKIPLNINYYYFKTNTEPIYKYYYDIDSIDISDNLISTSINTEIPFFRSWNIELLYRHIFEHNLYSDGIGDRIKIGLNVSEILFKNKMNTALKLWADGHFNHASNLGYEGFHYGPYATDNSDLTLPDYWVFNLDFSVTVSKMTLGWKVNNILKIAETVTNKLLPNLNENYLLITNSNDFPSMGRFVTFNIIWNLDN